MDYKSKYFNKNIKPKKNYNIHNKYKPKFNNNNQNNLNFKNNKILGLNPRDNIILLTPDMLKMLNQTRVIPDCIFCPKNTCDPKQALAAEYRGEYYKHTDKIQKEIAALKDKNYTDFRNKLPACQLCFAENKIPSPCTYYNLDKNFRHTEELEKIRKDWLAKPFCNKCKEGACDPQTPSTRFEQFRHRRTKEADRQKFKESQEKKIPDIN